MERYHSYSKPRKKVKSEIENRNGSEPLRALCHALFHVYVLSSYNTPLEVVTIIMPFADKGPVTDRSYILLLRLHSFCTLV